jgi:type I restriction enzyme, R subunit
MTHQSEAQLEEKLIKQLETLGFHRVKIESEADLVKNLKNQLEKLNHVTFSDTEFNRIVMHLQKGTVFDKAKTLRGKYDVTLDNGDVIHIDFFNSKAWCQNHYQVTQQITIEGKYKNRYDVTLLINGLPLVQIELKRRGLEMKEAFNQVARYHKHSYWANLGLFDYVQMFVISNGVNTKYFANNRKQNFNQTFYWTDEKNKKITELEQFTQIFLEKCHLSKMIARYTVLHESDKIAMILRPYQYHAVEKIIHHVSNSSKNGYIWHTTGSGKTLTSFKTAQILSEIDTIDKILFVVDRNDLDYQTAREFNHFEKDCVDQTKNTKHLIEQINNPNSKVIVTTIQKLNNAISNKHYLKDLEYYQDKKIIFIFDECHRSQFGETHKKIKNFFKNHQMFGFTGTPIFDKNAGFEKKITLDLFDERLHSYVLPDAISDENVLKFSIEYVGHYQRKSKNDIDILVNDNIDENEILDSDIRLGKIVDYILAYHNTKTYNREFTSIFCVSSVKNLCRYYDIFKQKDHNLKIATIFSYQANEDPNKNQGENGENVDGENIAPHSREKLESYVNDYNKMFNEQQHIKDSFGFQSYYKNIAKRMRQKDEKNKAQIDILLVVNMFLTGFDVKELNTLYADKNLKNHGLIQAFSRTNRLHIEKKSHGFIVSFRNLKENADNAIRLFSNVDNKEEINVADILVKPYEEYIEDMNKAIAELYLLTPEPDSVSHLYTEEEESLFVKNFREVTRLKNALAGFSDFSFDDIKMTEQDFENYKGKYLDIYEKVQKNKAGEKISILDDIDFEIALIHRDEIDVTYIMRLLGQILNVTGAERDEKIDNFINMIHNNPKLRNKQDLIQEFINKHLLQIDPNLEENQPIEDKIMALFDAFIATKRKIAFNEICEQEKLIPEKVKTLISDMAYTQKSPLREQVIDLLEQKPSIKERKTIIERLMQKIKDFIQIFDEGL